LLSENNSNVNRDDKSSKNLMQVDLKDEKKVDIKNKSLKNDKVLKSKKETNVNKNDLIDVDSKSLKEANIKKTPKSDDIEDVNLSNF